MYLLHFFLIPNNLLCSSILSIYLLSRGSGIPFATQTFIKDSGTLKEIQSPSQRAIILICRNLQQCTNKIFVTDRPGRPAFKPHCPRPQSHLVYSEAIRSGYFLLGSQQKQGVVSGRDVSEASSSSTLDQVLERGRCNEKSELAP